MIGTNFKKGLAVVFIPACIAFALVSCGGGNKSETDNMGGDDKSAPKTFEKDSSVENIFYIQHLNIFLSKNCYLSF